MLTLVQRTGLCRAQKAILQNFVQYETLAIVSTKSNSARESNMELVHSTYQDTGKVFDWIDPTRTSFYLNNPRNMKKISQPRRTDAVTKDFLSMDATDLFFNQNKAMMCPNVVGSHVVNFSASPALQSDSNSKSSSSEEKKPDLDKVAYDLTYDLTNVFVQQTNWKLYHPNLVFEDRIRGKRYEGLLEYVKFVNLVRILAHVKFVYVRFHVLNLSKHPEDGTIRIRWRVAGLGVLRMVLRYIPDQMWKRGNMDKFSPSWYDGYSTFYVDGDNKITKHIADRRMPDQDKEPAAVNPVVEKLKKLKPAPAPSPVM